MSENTKKIKECCEPCLEGRCANCWEGQLYLYCSCSNCHKPQGEKKTNQVEQEEWCLTFKDIKNIIELCNVKDVETWSEGLTISFVPKDVIGKAWLELKEKMHRITKK